MPHLTDPASPPAPEPPTGELPGTSPGLEALADAWREALGAELGFARELRRSLHASPCVSGEEEPTALAWQAAVESAGVRLQTVAQTGRIGRLGPATGPAVVLRAELDALPVTETTGVPYASVNGAMHACGHDVHLAALAAVVRAGARLEAEGTALPVGLVPLAQPREETYPSGAEEVVASGWLEAAEVRYAVAAHVHPEVPAGGVALGEGFVNAAADEFEVTLEGDSGHGAYPHRARDVVAPLASIALGLPEVVRRTVPPLNGALLSIGTLTAGTGAPNVLPGTGRIYGTMRTTTAQDRVALAEAVSDLASGVATAYGVRASIRFIRGEPVLANDALLARATGEQLAVFGYEAAEPLRSLGADDFSHFTEAAPVLMAFVGVGGAGGAGAGAAPGEGREQPPLHDSAFLPGDDAVQAVAETLLAGYLAAARLIAGAEAD